MKTTTRILAAALALCALAPVRAHAAGTTLTPVPFRLTDEIITSDLGLLSAWGQRLDAVAATPGRKADVYRETLAREWLATARREYQENDRTPFPSAALGRAAGLIEQLEGGAPAVTGKDLPASTSVAGSTRVHPELWAVLDSLEHADAFGCAAELLAKMEVQLQTAGNEAIDQGECNVTPHVVAAEALGRQARLAEEACAAPPVAVAPAPAPAPAPLAPTPTVETPPTAVPTAEELRIPRDVHFALDKHFISPQSRQVIEGIVAILKKYPTITVRLEGHTDSRASVAYNLALSKRRVNATAAVFQQLGIDPKRITTSFKGKGELAAQEDSNKGFALNRRVEMVFVDAEGRDIVGEKQEGDLQLEKGKPRRR